MSSSIFIGTTSWFPKFLFIHTSQWSVKVYFLNSQTFDNKFLANLLIRKNASILHIFLYTPIIDEVGCITIFLLAMFLLLRTAFLHPISASDFAAYLFLVDF